MIRIVLIFFILFSSIISSTFASCSLTGELSASNFLIACSQDSSGSIAWVNPDESTDGIMDIRKKIEIIAKSAISLGALFAVGAIVWAGIQYTKAYGDDEKLKHAKSTGIFALIGLILLMGSFSFVDTFIQFIYSVVK